MRKYEILKKVFGFEKFRPFQEEAVEAILRGRDLLVILPTGGGKSLCFQLPALMMEGVAVVVSPLIALMQDQVRALVKNDIEAAAIHSDMESEEIKEVYRRIEKGNVKLLYVAPERITTEGFIDFLRRVPVSLFVIDEAHCVSEWGHEFRGDYRRLGLLKRNFPKIPVAAFTATATPKVEEDIVAALELCEPLSIRGKPIRENLHIKTAVRIGNGRKQLIDFLRAHHKESGIVYTFTRKEAEETAEFLKRRGFVAEAYHAGLDPARKVAVLRDFLYDRIDIVVATIAFGMGIDKSDVRFVVHTSLPKTVENYYQEIGRAGRDGLASETLLLYTKADEVQKRGFIDGIESEAYRNLMMEKLAGMYRFAAASRCKHQMIAAYFGEEVDICKERCSSCTRLPVAEVDITEEAQKILSAIYRTGQLFGRHHIIDILRGSGAEKISRLGHDKLSVYGIGKTREKAYWMAVCDRLFELDAIGYNAHLGLKIEPEGAAILKGERRVVIDFEKIAPSRTRIPQKRASYGTPQNEIFEKLRSLRRKIASEENLPAYRVFNDKTLLEMAETLPQDPTQMLRIGGVGEVKFKRYGEAFLRVCQEANRNEKRTMRT